MQTSVACPKCGRAFQVPPELLKKRLRCLQCQHVFAAQDDAQAAVTLPSVSSAARQKPAALPDEEPEERRFETRTPHEDYGVPGYLWMFAAFPWGLLLLALGGCLWGLVSGLTAAVLSGAGIALIQIRRLPVGMRLAGLLALDGVALLLMTVGGVVAISQWLSPAGGPGQGTVANLPNQLGQSGRPQDANTLPPAPDAPLPAVQPLFAKGPRVFLADMEEFGVQAGPWPFSKGQINDGRAIRVNGVLSPHGLCMHPPWAPGFASVRYRLGKQAAVFKATVAINETSNWCWSPATFTVLGDGRPLWQSAWIAHNHTHSQPCSVNVSGVDVLELRVQVVNGSDGVHAVWVEPRLLQKADTADE